MGLKLRLPATSANLGPGFDALGLAMRLYLEVEAEAAGEFSIAASGRDAELVGSLEGNLMVETYRELAPAGPALALRVANEIPLGMGCGSSAAALVAGVMLANHFAELRMSREKVLAEAARREGHPDNVAACVLGGMTASAATAAGVTAVSFGAELPWRLLVVVPETRLATSEARALLPESYSRADAVANVQATALLVAAFALERKDLLAAGTRDRLHQPYRSEACPLLRRMHALVGAGGVLSATLSGAGPSVLLIVDEEAVISEAVTAIRRVAEEPVEVLETGISRGAEMDVVGLTD
jgi:homoserine kinase